MQIFIIDQLDYARVAANKQSLLLMWPISCRFKHSTDRIDQWPCALSISWPIKRGFFLQKWSDRLCRRRRSTASPPSDQWPFALSICWPITWDLSLQKWSDRLCRRRRSIASHPSSDWAASPFLLLLTPSCSCQQPSSPSSHPP